MAKNKGFKFNEAKHGSVEDALTAYNRGKPGQSKYSRDVMERMQKYEKS